MSEPSNPYSPSAVDAPSELEIVRRRANLGAILGVVGMFCGFFVSPGAIYFGHDALRRMRRSRVGLEHRGAAEVAVVLGWVGTALFLAVLTATARALMLGEE